MVPVFRTRPVILAAPLLSVACLAAAAPSPALDAPRAPRVDAPVAGVESTSEVPLRTLVLPFRPLGEKQPDWLSRGIGAYLAEGISLGGRVVVAPDECEEALEAEGLADEPLVPMASGALLARRLGARWLVTGTWDAKGTHVALTAREVDVTRLSLVAEARTSGEMAALPGLLGTLARGVVSGPSGPDAPVAADAGSALDALAATPSAALVDWMQGFADSNQAVAHFQASLDADQDFVPARLGLADAELDAGRPETVTGLLGRLPASLMPSRRARADALRGRALLAVGNARGAIDVLAQAATASPSRDTLLWLAEAHLAAGDRPAAIATAGRLLALAPNDPDAKDLVARAEGRLPASPPHPGS